MTKRVLICQMVSEERMAMGPEGFEKLEKKIENVKDDLWDAIEEDRCGD